MNTLVKWPGGKAREIKYIEGLIPPFERYCEPFFGGGALYFYLRPRQALINDISPDLTEFYRLVKAQDPVFYACLCAYDHLLTGLLAVCDARGEELLALYGRLRDAAEPEAALAPAMGALAEELAAALPETDKRQLAVEESRLAAQLRGNGADKLRRTLKNEKKVPFSREDLRENLITGFMSGLYMYFRDVYNDLLLGRVPGAEPGFRAANFYFIREYCYGSMFRYNARGEFNIPYGGMSYNRKGFQTKIDRIFSPEIRALFAGTQIACGDFAPFLENANLTDRDFLFLDPPYDSDFSDYEGKAFSREDQRRLAEALGRTRARFLLVIKNTDFIHSLYADRFHILSFDKTYAYNVRSRNDRSAEHLIIANYPVK